LLASLPANQDPNLLVGFGSNDDAGVYRITDEIAIITTADFITPPVDDPYLFGQIAAANALSDVYAMGGKPLTCLNLIGFPSKKLSPEILNGIVAGALDKIVESGAVLAGGHTTEDDEPKFGLSVVGIVHPEKIWTNNNARPGDALLLTKPIGSGVLFNANRKKLVSPEAMTECINILITLNKNASEVMKNFEIHSVTDITGFGLAGHCFEMAKASQVTFEIMVEKVPIMRKAIEMYQKGINTGMNASNLELVKKHTFIKKDLPSHQQEILVDPQTSGGLLVALPAEQSEALLKAFHQHGVTEARIIGKVTHLQDKFSLIFK
jgi:selenide, water dikinase